MLRALLAWLLKNAIFRLYSSPTAIGRRLGGHDIAGCPDSFIILHIELGGSIVLLGYFQTS